MAEPSNSPAGATAVASDVNNLPVDLAGGKRSAAEAFEGDSVEDLKDTKTTLDDVLVSPVGKKSKLLDEELPDVDDNEAFPLQEDDMDADLAIGLENGENIQDMDGDGLNLTTETLNMAEMDQGNPSTEDQDVDDLAPPEEEDESEPPTSQNNEIDIVDVDEDEEDEEEEPHTYSQDAEEEEEYDDEQETARSITRAHNQREARQLLQQLSDSARSKLCLTALEKYGEELFYGHEDARDAILVDACAQDSVLSLMRDAIRVRDLYMRGSAAAPVELDDDDDDEEEETGGYEDEEEDEEEEEEEDKPAGSAEEDDDDEIVVISEEEAEDSEAPNSGNEGQAGNASHAAGSDNQDAEVDTEEKAQPAESDEEDEEETKDEDAALPVGDLGAAEGSTSVAPATATAT